ncbi:DUF736 family protein [Leptospira kirschneri]|uniref:DUF736 domain-containing protein n=2 Tax=Leptospira kirschneri TaxID=29507 RepID=A0A1T1E083_9LEPT|nr:DUF736 family protein [Leptospira kirschneri]EJO71748.1 PF05284 domain protein [Leptospira kirschneri serovar Grippotyphosa str. RM52]EKO51436.1 PF05284 domain protein [Leptospira kirschneri str. 200802841]EKQ82186.1 PF05284 domain protein [Leptospira kirschneri serovar Grippotyphosa str. Moskva]EKR10235.1 PF05284 domain protein [Leptospira kirschneri serovar Valbuzzi str. 200702274]EMK07435.1 PF05284 domain protein [Leptospira kirschneri str. MMD1493]
MAEYTLKEKKGSLFSNATKEKETQPDYTGKVLLEGKTYRLAGWIRKSATGKNYLSLSLSEPNLEKKSEGSSVVMATDGNDFTDIEEDFPF